MHVGFVTDAVLEIPRGGAPVDRLPTPFVAMFIASFGRSLSSSGSTPEFLRTLKKIYIPNQVLVGPLTPI